jgi:plastocyanin
MKSINNIIIVVLLVLNCAAIGGNIKGTVKAKRAKYIINTVIYIEKIEGKEFAPPKEHMLMDQKNLTFQPHVLPVLVGTTVNFLNSDDVLHNVFSPDKCAEKFNLGSFPKGQKRSYTFNDPGCVSVMLCNVHPEMEAYIFVLETPYSAVSEKDGSYVIKDVPPGKYILKIWNERMKSKDVEVTVPKSGDVTVDFQLKR